jgi:hypothetical protein
MARTVFTTITPLPPQVTRETVLATLHDHVEMIDLNPSHEEHHMTKPPPEATPEEYHCQWYSITGKVSYLSAHGTGGNRYLVLVPCFLSPYMLGTAVAVAVVVVLYWTLDP